VLLLLALACAPAGAIGLYSGGNYALIDATVEVEALSVDLDGGRGAGWQLGAWVDIPLIERLNLRAGLAWSRYHSSAEHAESGSEDLGEQGRYDWTARVAGDNEASVIALPVDLIARPLRAHPGWFLSLGGSLLTPHDARLLGEGELLIYQDDVRIQTVRESYDVDYKEQMKDFVALMGLGLGRDFQAWGAPAFAWLRYERSASDWADAEGYKIGVHGFTLLVGVRI
jgi:hypothetical protein